ncbi:tetratricopeptide repeat protein [Aerophototrophica crusticola]|uniref:Tetratricopeptide repeat protein n=1 Tax=Aerophototrophica crusticola TaxID=1709002 RepID=A0A858RAF7_9PROT|nr:tetratricopeptide repeat protein [Rhodospirillaceae bacterium B3]
MKTRQKALELLRTVGTLPDDRIDLAEAALALAVLDQPGAEPEPYRRHLAQLALDVADATQAAGKGPLPLSTRIAALRDVLYAKHGYRGDSDTYEDLQNANLIRVIDRRLGLPVALGILLIHAARAQGWGILGLSFPGHFLVRMDLDGERAILDPFDGAARREPRELRDLLKQTAGAEAELTPEHYTPVTNREILLRLQNNLKLRHLRSDRADQAVEVIENMLLFDPENPGLWREAGLLNAHLGKLTAAIQAFETFMVQGSKLGASPQLLHQTASLVQQLKTRLN